jgi:hypothetical protein
MFCHPHSATLKCAHRGRAHLPRSSPGHPGAPGLRRRTFPHEARLLLPRSPAWPSTGSLGSATRQLPAALPKDSTEDRANRSNRGSSGTEERRSRPWLRTCRCRPQRTGRRARLARQAAQRARAHAVEALTAPWYVACHSPRGMWRGWTHRCGLSSMVTNCNCCRCVMQLLRLSTQIRQTCCNAT